MQAKNQNDFPTPLYDEGYVLEGIETRFNVSDAQNNYHEVLPELQLKSDRENNLLFVECKAGCVEKSQLKRYNLISEKAIKEGKITSLDSTKDINFDLMYLGTHEKKDKLIKSIKKDNNQFPIVIYEDNKLWLYADKEGKNRFKSEILNKVFKEVEIKNPPVSYIPFTTDDKIEFVILAILREIYTFINGAEFDCEDLLKAIFKERYGCISPSYIKQLKATINITLKELKDTYLCNHLSKGRTSNKWRISTKTAKPFITACEKLKEKMEDKKYMSNLMQWS